MKHLVIIISAVVLLLPTMAKAAEQISFDQAAKLSSQGGKPLLLEFFRDD
ncbi:MAG: hypothetical protein OEV49_01210 [candidate division Zixibacteria bacterium]|nr:hypothetical protein [candidate division Zixibacteria bacterium]MDH3937191.1 hypothetical protein [candidate division Zixibacteria bacterium]MDH4032454.1 hypothetical protein [candidate division Zixibacteria bacterium]